MGIGVLLLTAQCRQHLTRNTYSSFDMVRVSGTKPKLIRILGVCDGFSLHNLGLLHTDHALNEKGVHQALSLNKRWKDSVAERTDNTRQYDQVKGRVIDPWTVGRSLSISLA